MAHSPNTITSHTQVGPQSTPDDQHGPMTTEQAREYLTHTRDALVDALLTRLGHTVA